MKPVMIDGPSGANQYYWYKPDVISITHLLTKRASCTFNHGPSKSYKLVPLVQILRRSTYPPIQHDPSSTKNQEEYFPPIQHGPSRTHIDISKNQQTTSRPHDPSRAQPVPLVQTIRGDTFHPINTILLGLVLSISKTQQTTSRPRDPSRVHLVQLVKQLEGILSNIQHDASRSHIEYIESLANKQRTR